MKREWSNFVLLQIFEVLLWLVLLQPYHFHCICRPTEVDKIRQETFLANLLQMVRNNYCQNTLLFVVSAATVAHALIPMWDLELMVHVLDQEEL